MFFFKKQIFCPRTENWTMSQIFPYVVSYFSGSQLVGQDTKMNH